MITTSLTTQVSPTLLRSAIDERIVRIRPSSTPLDQISRMAGSRKCASMKVGYYAVDIKKGSTAVTREISGNFIGRQETVIVNVEDPGMFAPNDTMMFTGVHTESGDILTAFVTSVDNKQVSVMFANIFDNDTESEAIHPDIPSGTTVVRMGRAAGELDVQTSQYVAIPLKKENYCQIFKSQIEESQLQRLSDKEVGWTFSDQEEAAVLDMRMCMERSFLFGSKGVLRTPEGSDIMLTGGIWKQAGKQFSYSPDSFGGETVVKLMRMAFTESNGSTRKVLLAGSGLIEKLHSLDYDRVISSSQRVTKWGVDFDQIVSKFGTLYVVRSEVFDLCGMDNHGMIIDPEYITKYSHIPFSAERISFRKQGLRNTEGIVLTEASCLVLRFPDAHLRIVPAS